MNHQWRAHGQRVVRNVNQLHDNQTSVGDRLSDNLARFGGSWTFIVICCGALAIWVGLNSLQLLLTPFDPYPYIFLNLVLSCLAAIQAPIILMSQNRQAARDRIAADQDYACNLKAELEVEQLHEKLDLLREKQWIDLVELQQHQIMLLNQLLENTDLPTPPTPPGNSFGTVIPLGASRNAHDSPEDPPPAGDRGDNPDQSAAGGVRRRPRVVDGRTHRRRSPASPGS